MVQTSDKRLSIEVIQPLGKKEMPVQAFLAGYKHLLN
jgi:methionyl-tRNA formyltransferase